MAHGNYQVGDLTATIGDNSAHGQHRQGYNGVWRLTHRMQEASVFVPFYAGLNLEHIFDGHQYDRDNSRRIFFEPRNAAMTYRQISNAEAELHQPPTPTFHLESWTRFRLVAPHYLDMTFRCRPRQHVFHHNYIGLFWASYINAPLDKSMYFRSSRGDNQIWQQLCTQQHNDESTVRHRADNLNLQFSEGYPEALFRNLSPLRYELPFYYGLFHNMVYIMMFESHDGIRFTHSPSGGGLNQKEQTTNPAWDFQYIIPQYEVNREYQFRARLACRAGCSRAEILREVNNWRSSL